MYPKRSNFSVSFVTVHHYRCFPLSDTYFFLILRMLLSNNFIDTKTNSFCYIQLLLSSCQILYLVARNDCFKLSFLCFVFKVFAFELRTLFNVLQYSWAWVSLHLILDSAMVRVTGKSSLGFGGLHIRSPGVTARLKAISHLEIKNAYEFHLKALKLTMHFFLGWFVVFLELSKLKWILCISQAPLLWMVFTKLGHVVCWMSL